MECDKLVMKVKCRKDRIPMLASKMKNLILRGLASGLSNFGDQFMNTPKIPSAVERAM